jgi:hypothetical protein
MIDIVINNEGYLCPENWSEISMSQASKLLEAVESVASEKIRQNTVNQVDDDTLRVAVYERVLSLVVGVSEGVAKVINKDELLDFGERYLDIFIESVTMEPLYEPCGAREFELNGSLHAIPDARSIAAYSGIYQFLYATDLHAADPIRNAPLVMATLCDLQKDWRAGKTTGATAIRTEISADEFARLPMSVAFELYAELMKLHGELQADYPYCYAETIAPIPMVGDSGGERYLWRELLYLVSGFRPSEIAAAREMSIREFFETINAGFRLRAIQKSRTI